MWLHKPLNLKLLQHEQFCLHLSNTDDENQGHFKQQYYLLNHSLIKKKKKKQLLEGF